MFLAAESSQAAVRGKSLANSSVVALSFWEAAQHSHGLSFNRSWSWFPEPRVSCYSAVGWDLYEELRLKDSCTVCSSIIPTQPCPHPTQEPRGAAVLSSLHEALAAQHWMSARGPDCAWEDPAQHQDISQLHCPQVRQQVCLQTDVTRSYLHSWSHTSSSASQWLLISQDREHIRQVSLRRNVSKSST